MSDEQWSILFGFSSVLTYSSASLLYSYFALQYSALWMNIVKSSVGFLLTVVALLLGFGSLELNFGCHWPFLLSGFIGLNVGDFFILSGYRRLGPGRTLLLFGFQPLFIGLVSYGLWDQQLYPMQLFSVVFFILCLFILSFESFKKQGNWEILGLIFAFLGMALDTVGVLLTKHGFIGNPGLNGFEAHYLRLGGAMAGFVFFSPFLRQTFQGTAEVFHTRAGFVLLLASFLGTFLSLVFYMEAIKLGPLVVLSAIVLTDPMITTFLECAWKRVVPSRYLWLAMGCFMAAMFCLFYHTW